MALAELLPNGANATEPANASTLLITPHFFMEDKNTRVLLFTVSKLRNRRTAS